MPSKRIPLNQENGLFFCPVSNCGFKTTNKRSYPNHWNCFHSNSFKFICNRCEAGFQKQTHIKKHEEKCKGTQDLNNKLRIRKYRYPSGAQEGAPEEVIQELKESVNQLENIVEEKDETIKALKLTISNVTKIGNHVSTQVEERDILATRKYKYQEKRNAKKKGRN